MAKTLVFRTLPIHDLRIMLKHAKVKTYQPGDVVLQQGTANNSLHAVIKGGCSVHKNGERIAHLLPGQFVGEMSFLTAKAVSANVVAESPTEILYWTNESLNKLFSKNNSLHKYMVTLLGHDLAIKLADS